MRSAKWIAFGFVCLVAGGMVAALSQKAGDSAPSLTDNQHSDAIQGLTGVDRMLPDFELSGLNEETWTAESLKGKPWVINFWATWCSPCIEEIPSMNAAYDVLEPEGIGMLAINVGEGEEAVTEFLEKIPIDFSNALGDSGTLQRWSLKVLPTTIVVNAEGQVLFEAVGSREWDDEKLLQQVIDLL